MRLPGTGVVPPTGGRQGFSKVVMLSNKLLLVVKYGKKLDH
jgi:hypothetical protein